MGGCGRKEGRCPAGSSKEVVVGGGSRHVGGVEKIDRTEEKSWLTVESASRLPTEDVDMRETLDREAADRYFGKCAQRGSCVGKHSRLALISLDTL